MPAVGPESPPASDQRIDRPSDPDGNAAHPARERLSVERLDQEVDVVVLDRVLDDPEAVGRTPIGSGDGEPQGGQDMLGAQGAEEGPEGDVDRMRRGVRGPSTVQSELTVRDSLAAGPWPSAAPGVLDRQR